MTTPTDLPVTLARLEGKLDTLAVKVDAGDRASTQLVELVKTEVGAVRASVDDLKVAVGAVRTESDQAISAVRVSLEGQVKDLRSDMDRASESAAAERGRIFTRMDDSDKKLNRIIGGTAVGAAVLGALGVIAQAIR